MNQIIFNPRWKEELEAISDDGILIFELTMGKLHVYFPGQERWKECVPDWARGKWEIYLQPAAFGANKITFRSSVVDNAYVYEEKYRKDFIAYLIKYTFVLYVFLRNKLNMKEVKERAIITDKLVVEMATYGSMV